MSFTNFLKDEEAKKGLFQITVMILVVGMTIVLFYLAFLSKNPNNSVLPLLTFILGEFIGGLSVYLWGRKKNGK